MVDLKNGSAVNLDNSAANLDEDNDVLVSNNGISDRSDAEMDEDVDDEQEDANVNVIVDQFKHIIELTPEDVEAKVFSSEDAAYRFYHLYGKLHGFGIRKQEVRYDVNGKVKTRQFVCNKAGLRDKKHLMRDNRKRDHRPLTRTNCKAKLRVKLDPTTLKWIVVSFEETHNHQLCESNFVPLIRTYRGLTDADKAQVNSLHAQGVRTCQIMGYMMDQKGGHAGVGYSKKDLFNHIEQERRFKVKDGDIYAALTYLQCKADNDPMFFSKYMVTDDGKLTHLFWADGHSRADFQCFGDVLAFDSTYKKNKYNKPLVIFSGKNHHNETVIFGCALVSDETTETYKWVLETFLESMCNKHPKGVVTDGDAAMREAIKKVFPDATHRLCAWHLGKNAYEHVKNDGFLEDFNKAMYANFTPEKFETFWNDMVVKHQLEGNNWVSQTYNKRFMWATAYLRDKFWAGLRTTSLCEGVNSGIKTYVKRKNTIVEVLYNLENSLRDYRYKELVKDFNSFYTEPYINSCLPTIERHAAKIFTRDIYKLVRTEILAAGSLNVIERTENEDKVIFRMDQHCQRRREHEVFFYKHECKFECGCMLFEYSGIPCSHIICAMRLDHMDKFPTSLILKRWLKDAKSSYISCYNSENKDNNMMVVARFGVLAACCNRLCHIAAKKREVFDVIRDEIMKLTTKLQQEGDTNGIFMGDMVDVRDPNVVKIKGTPQRKKCKKKFKCSSCNKSGHKVTTCPLLRPKDDDYSNGHDVGGSTFVHITKDQDIDKGPMFFDGNKSQEDTHRKQNKRSSEVGGSLRVKEKKHRSAWQNVKKDNLDKGPLFVDVENGQEVTETHTHQNKQKMKVDDTSRVKEKKHKALRQNLKNDMIPTSPVTQSDSIEGESMNPKCYTQKSNKDMKSTVPANASSKQNEQRVDILPPQHNPTFTFPVSEQGMAFPNVYGYGYGLVPYQPQFSQVPYVTPPNTLPVNTHFGAMQNGGWYNLLQNVSGGGGGGEGGKSVNGS